MYLNVSPSRLPRELFAIVRLLVALVLTGALGGAISQAQNAQADPSFQLVRGVPDTCSAEAGEEFRFEALANISFGSGSNQGTLTVEGVGQVATFSGNHNQPDYPIFGDGFYDFVVDQAYDVPAGTTITAEITTYTGLNQSGQLAYRSTLTYTCDLGETVSVDNQVLLDAPATQPDFVFDLPTVDPAFELTQGVPDTCSAEIGEEFRLDTFNNVSFGSGSNRVTLAVDGVGQVAVFEGNHNQPEDYPSIGNGFYDVIIDTAYDVPAGTPLTVAITTFTGLNQTGQVAYRSTLTYNCDLATDNTVTNEVLLDTVQPGTPAPAVDIPPVDPAFAFTTGVADTCTATTAAAIRFDTVNNVTFGNTSNMAELQVTGEGVVASLTNNHDQPAVYPSIGAGFYEFVLDTGYEIPANSPITAEITTYSGLNQGGQPIYRSTLIYDCTTGEVINLTNEILGEQAGN